MALMMSITDKSMMRLGSTFRFFARRTEKYMPIRKESANINPYERISKAPILYNIGNTQTSTIYKISDFPGANPPRTDWLPFRPIVEWQTCRPVSPQK